MAKEEAAVFYYEALEQLVAQPELQMLCRSMRGEEQMHLNQMRALYQKLKETAK
jgi:rubrerythrin